MLKTNFKNIKILVCGDAMLDKYWFGDATRLSPEAPVPIVKVNKEETRLGGAANVALNISKMGASACLLSICGNDVSGKVLLSMLSNFGIESELILDDTVPTIEKFRVVARQQQMLRADFEQKPSDFSIIKLNKKYIDLLDSISLVVLSDYKKGVLSQAASMISLARTANRPVSVDPKGDDWSSYRGATLITPNKNELRAVVGTWSSESDLRFRAQRLRESLEIKYLLLTRSEEGMTLFSEEDERDFPAQAREVFDVSGAGDTVIAVLATLVSSGCPLYEAVRLANKAGGIVVGKLGTACITPEELFRDE